ncbi:MAG: protein kinase [Planctomycetota bacterium]
MNLPDVIQDRYEVERLLGRGRFAEVWLARDRRAAYALRALKIFHSGAFGLEPVDWARREFNILKPLKHPRVVSVIEFDVMRGTGQPFYTLQVLFGDDIVTTLRRLPLNEALPHIVDLCRGLEYLHFTGLVHGDLKPQNVIVDRDRGVVLTDPLLPPALQEDVLPPIYGTVGFQAPEIIRREHADHRADLYSLGVILYHVLAGRSPFEARDPVDLIRLQLSRDPVDLALLDPHIPSHLCEIVSKLLKRDAAQRFERASQVILALSRGSGREFSVETAATRAAYVSEPPLVGREEERLSALEAMRQLASPVSERRVASLVIAGSRGSGKSRMLAELVREATALDIEVLHTPQSDDAVLGVFRSYLERVFDRVAPELPPQLSSRLQHYLAGRDDSPASPDLRAKLLAAVVTALLKAAAERALLLTVEELGALPGPAFQLLCELLGSLQNERLMIVATASEEDLDETRGAQLKRFREEGLLRDLRLKPLTEEQVVQWLDTGFERPSFSQDLARRLVESTGGKPMLIMEVLNSLVAQGQISRERERWALDPTLGDLPLAPSVASAIEQRLAQLPPPCRHLAACLAVIERPVSPDELKALFPDLPIPIDACLEQLAQGHLIRVAQERMVLHPSDTIKLALKHLSTDARRSLHATLLKTLSLSAGLATLAELATHAIGANDTEAIERYAADAGREAVTRLDYERALVFFESAVLHLAQPEERARVLLDLAGLSAAVGDMKRAVTAYEQLAQLAREHDDEARLARALNGLAQVHLERGDLLEGKRVIARAGTVSGRRGDQSARLSALTTLASLLLERGEYQEARPLFGEVLRAHHASGSGDAERWTCTRSRACTCARAVSAAPSTCSRGCWRRIVPPATRPLAARPSSRSPSCGHGAAITRPPRRSTSRSPRALPRSVIAAC